MNTKNVTAKGPIIELEGKKYIMDLIEVTDTDRENYPYLDDAAIRCTLLINNLTTKSLKHYDNPASLEVGFGMLEVDRETKEVVEKVVRLGKKMEKL